MAKLKSYLHISPVSSQNSWTLPELLFERLLPYLGSPQTFMHCGPGRTWIKNFQSNPTQKLFFDGVFITDQNDPSSSQKPNLTLMFFACYPNILFIIESFSKQNFKIKIPKEHDGNSPSQFELFTPTSPNSKSTTPLYLVVIFLSFKKKIVQLPSGSDLPMIPLPIP
ncbi:hypothetical protein O181_033480 [Austropuccinia psidii MF-1]|uniref:Uncharacterized protein n=1 Tax=Austropuccinia psidii MF-1 TaxID=1389203 RepID=A0A9Q3H9A0_9BASI|nr:hypothetical protein [Austropuccinia psidii MF-1]